MNIVEPIRDEEKITDIENYLKVKNERNYILFLVGLHTGLRISDILRLRVSDVYKKSTIYLTEKKTGKRKVIAASNKMKKALNAYIEKHNMQQEDYLIKSRKGFNNPIGRNMAYRIIKGACKIYGISNVGTHTLRKTFGYKHYQKYKDIEELRKYFNHSSSSVTTRYIGLQQEVMNKQVKDLWT